MAVFSAVAQGIRLSYRLILPLMRLLLTLLTSGCSTDQPRLYTQTRRRTSRGM
ncbi:hypothetical protein RSOL_202470 [Rhizoctonia solani AG-3 Rhs1AP]|uniref:Transmembrane protein n=1 Tax=Rhizoctonia solani AG-3 Rhs1AP TaxID=1086054 RepID=X8J4N5_9AGAM|nr:hypothetical protein RSOL_202470 [Rhizoctonia solani AG-3 Rhs1AP]